MKSRIKNRYFGRKTGSLTGLTHIEPSESKSAVKNRHEKAASQKNYKVWDSAKWGPAVKSGDWYIESPAVVKKPKTGIMRRIQKRKENKLKRWT